MTDFFRQDTDECQELTLQSVIWRRFKCSDAILSYLLIYLLNYLMKSCQYESTTYLTMYTFCSESQRFPTIE